MPEWENAPHSGDTSTLTLPRPADPIAKKAPLYHVILHNDDDHTYEYVIVMLVQLFGKDPERAYQHAKEVDSTGVTIVETTTFERAELKRDQIHAFGPDPRLARSAGSMSATIEPAE
ncbi:MAG: ATP-dependent Clp protease adaptor ClpS [Planctomycetota bacterium]